ncbi:MAG: XylR N-terminal domain-containing protein [candidate division Zixibacteria bacterium]|nr:XylR N-terminal domain-containing protein [candidate division Zixibacteria bacterium]
MSQDVTETKTQNGMKATDFDLSNEIKFDPDKGLTTFRDSRIVLFDADAIGLLRQSLIDHMGIEKAREFFLKFGYQHGFSDFIQMKVNYKFESEMDLLASGPVIHTYEGIVQATPKEISFNRETGEFYFTGTWTNSYEAEQHLSYQEVSSEPVCWTLMGYASGWCTAFFGKPLLAIEPVCMGKGDDHCEWEIQPLSKWGEEAIPYITALDQFWNND